jgi:hypothetical protein
MEILISVPVAQKEGAPAVSSVWTYPDGIECRLPFNFNINNRE